jgi:hypothetical protein
MVKIEDGALISAAKLLSGEGQDDSGNPLKFEESRNSPSTVGGVAIPSYYAIAPLASDADNRLKMYTFSLEDTLVKVSVATRSQEEINQFKSAAEERSKSLEQQQQQSEEPKQQEEEEEEEATQPTTEKAFKTVSPEESSLPESHPPVEEDETLRILGTEEEEESKEAATAKKSDTNKSKRQRSKRL